MSAVTKPVWESSNTDEPGDRLLDLGNRDTVEIGPSSDGWWSVTVVRRDPSGGVSAEDTVLVASERKAVQAAERIWRDAQAGGEPGAQPGGSAPEPGPVDTFTRRRLTVDDVRERVALPGGHRDRVVLATSLWGDYLTFTPWRLLRVEETSTGPRVWVRLATDHLQPEQWLPLHEQRLYGLAPDGV